jgi:hypothetical protein
MRLEWQVVLAATLTIALFVAIAWVVARVLQLSGVKAQLVATTLRLLPTMLAVLAVAFSGAEHRVALVFTVGATYFAATLVDAVLRFRNEGACRAT